MVTTFTELSTDNETHVCAMRHSSGTLNTKVGELMNALVVPLRREESQQREYTNMKQLDFIPNAMYRSVLEDSFVELEDAVSVGAWRAAMLLAGGIFESLLTMYLHTKKQSARSNVDPNKLPVDKTMGACIKLGMKAAGSKEAKKLVLNYRKLIHPSADIRLRAQILEADVREARMVLNSVLEFISPTPVPWAEEDKTDEHIMELELEDDTESEAPWDGGQEADENVAEPEAASASETNIRLPGSRGNSAHSQESSDTPRNIRIPGNNKAAEVSEARIQVQTDKEEQQPNIRIPGQQRTVQTSANGTAKKKDDTTEQVNVRIPETRQPEPADAPVERTTNRDDPPAANVPPSAQSKESTDAPATDTASGKSESAPAGEKIDPRAAIRLLDTVVDRNLRGPQIAEMISTLEPQLQFELLNVLIPKTAIRIHIGKEELSDVDRTAALLSLRELFRQLFDLQPEDARTEILEGLASALQGEHQTRGIVYVDYFFEAPDLQYLSEPLAGALKKHVFQRMENNQNRFFLDSITDIWFYLSKDEIDEFTNVCLSCIIYGSTHELRMETKSWMKRNAWEKMDDALRSDVLAPLQRWIENYEFFNDASHANLVRDLKAIAERR